MEKLTLRAKHELAVSVVQTEVEAYGVRVSEMGDLMGDFEIRIL